VSTRVITSAGRDIAPPPGKTRKEVIARIRSVLRNPQATDQEADDALEALTELAKTED
jgi:hypothetical protein